jgi:hypothetical protein
MECPRKKTTNVILPSKNYIFSFQFQRYVITKRGTSVLHEVFAMGTSSRGSEIH